MDRGAIVLRAAKPTLEEGLVFARYLDEAAEGFFGLMLGSAAARVVAEAFTHPDSQYSFENVTFAERERRLVGMATGFTADQHRGFSDRPLQEAEEYPALRMLAVRIVFAPLLRILSTIGDGDFYILAVAVDEALRGQGVGSVLMDAMEKRAHCSESTRLVLDVAVKNEGARCLYERRGMSVESSWPRSRLFPHMLHRMAKPL